MSDIVSLLSGNKCADLFAFAINSRMILRCVIKMSKQDQFSNKSGQPAARSIRVVVGVNVDFQYAHIRSSCGGAARDCHFD